MIKLHTATIENDEIVVEKLKTKSSRQIQNRLEWEMSTKKIYIVALQVVEGTVGTVLVLNTFRHIKLDLRAVRDIFFFEFESVEEAMKTALDMWEVHPLCYAEGA